MLEFIRTLRSRGDLALRLPGMLLAFLVAEVFYRFHSFALECAAFLLTWLVLDWTAERIADLLRGHAAAGPTRPR